MRGLDRALLFAQTRDRKVVESKIEDEEEEESGGEGGEPVTEVVAEEEHNLMRAQRKESPLIEEEAKTDTKQLDPNAEVLAKLGPFITTPEAVSAPFGKIVSITDWQALHHRYKPEHIPYLNKALNARLQYDEKLNHPDWKLTVEDKKEGLNIYVRTTPDGYNAVKATGVINHPAEHIFITIGNIT